MTVVTVLGGPLDMAAAQTAPMELRDVQAVDDPVEIVPAAVPALPMELRIGGDGERGLWRALMSAVYGSHDQERDCWVTTVRDGDETRSFCLRPHASAPAPGAPERLLLVAAGTEIGDEGMSYTCHACAGASGFFVLDRRGSNFTLSAALPLARFGAWGEVPPASAYQAVRMGAASWGWAVTMIYNNRGTLVGTHLLFGEHDGRIAPLGVLSAGAEPEDRAAQAQDAYRHAIRFDASQPALPFYPAVLEAEGVRGGAPYRGSIAIRFDAASGSYVPQ